jgi:probable HAF family extracellular repeat protein
MQRATKRVSWAGIAAYVMLASAALADEPYLIGLGRLNQTGPRESESRGISPDGTCVVGKSTDRAPQGDDFGWTAFRWTQGRGMVGIGALPGRPASTAAAASLGGETIVGQSRLGNGPESTRAFRWTSDGGMIDLGTLGAVNNYYNSSYAAGISADGSVAIGRTTSPQGFQAFRWTAAEGMVGLGSLPGPYFDSTATGISADGSTIVGWSSGQAFRWTAADGMQSIGVPGESSVAYAVSADGSTIVGRRTRAGDDYGTPYRWTAQTGMVSLGTLNGGAYLIYPQAVSGDGSIIVGYLVPAPSGGIAQAFIWDIEHGVRDLRRVLIEDYHLTTVEDWLQLADANGISADGRTIVGFGSGPDGAEAWVAHVPEPATAMVLIVAVVLAGVKRRVQESRRD